MRDAGHRLDVVDHGRLAEHAFDGRKRRLDPRPGPLAFEAFDQPGLFAADIGRRAAMHVNIERKVAAADVLAQVARRRSTRRSPPASARATADIRSGDRCRPSWPGWRRQLRMIAFDHLVRIVLHQDAVVERARLALVGVDAHVDRAGMVLGQKRPLQPGGKAGPAAAAQVAALDHLDERRPDASRQHLLRARV